MVLTEPRRPVAGRSLALVMERDAMSIARPVVRWLLATPTAPSIARGQVDAVVSEWGVPILVDDAKIVVSELVTNAVNASTGTGAGLEDPFLSWVAVRFSDTGRRFVIEVFDAAPGVPVVQADDPMAETGKGLRLVETLATWGSYRVATGSGKIVWAGFDHGGSRGGSDPVSGWLPRRSPAMPDAPPTVADDLALLGRVRQGLRTLTFPCAPGLAVSPAGVSSGAPA